MRLSRSASQFRTIACIAAFQCTTALEAAPLRAVFARIEGNVTIQDFGDGASQEADQLHRATILKVIGAGDRIRVPTRGAAGLVCSSERWIELTEQVEETLDERLCEKGRPLEAGSFAKLAPANEAARSLDGAMVFERTPRTDSESGTWPILISPRNSAVFEEGPTLVWKAKSAGPFRILIRSPTPSIIALGMPACSPLPGKGDFLCTTPFPENMPRLKPGQFILLHIQAPIGTSSAFEGEDMWPWLRRITEDQAAGLPLALKIVPSLELPEAATSLARAAILSSNELFSAAIEELTKNSGNLDRPEIACALGKLYLRIDLGNSAEKYFVAAKGRGLPIHQAEASLGLGSLELTRHHFDEARAHFAQAELLFAQLGLKKDAESARLYAAKARMKLRSDDGAESNRDPRPQQ